MENLNNSISEEVMNKKEALAYIKKHKNDSRDQLARATGYSTSAIGIFRKELGIGDGRLGGKNKRMTMKEVSEELKLERREKGYLAENRNLKSKVAALIKEANAQDRIVEYAKNAIDALPPARLTRQPKITSSTSVEAAVLVGSCWHIGEVVNRYEMGDFGEYNFGIFLRRLQFLVDKTISFTKDNMKSHQFDELHIFLTGD